jgi:hypothetical protein
MKLKSSYSYLLIGAAMFALPALVQAQPTAHYVPGAEGIKAASLPPPGIYLRDYNVGYYANQRNDPQGHKIDTMDAKAYIYANVPRILWITDQQLLGGYLGLDALLPLQYTDLDLGVKGGPSMIDEHNFGIGDFFIEGTWSKHVKQFDFALGYGVWAPTGDYSDVHVRAGSGYWTHMLTAGATWYIDANKAWALSVLNRYEINQKARGVTKGQAYTVEGGLSYGVTKTVDVGAIGYYQQKVTSDSNSTAAARDRVAGVGPEISAFFPKATLGLSLRYAYEFMAENRLEGHTATLTITKRF